MVFVEGIVKDGLVKLPNTIKLADGSRVLITLIDPKQASKTGLLPEEIEAEDVAFIRASRRRFSKQLQDTEE